jgi:hypothetical protein
MSSVCKSSSCNNFSHLAPREALIELSKCFSYTFKDEVKWKQIPNFNNYEISSSGMVRSKKSYKGKTRILVPTLRLNKYCYVTLTNGDGKRVGFPMDRLMIISFYNLPSNCKFKVRHLDNLSYNNQLENLHYTLKY